MVRRYAKSAEVERGIIAACAATFGESGFHGASMAEIARRAGVSHTGLLHHFPTKQDLLTAILDVQDEDSGRYLEAHSGFDAAADPVEVLRGMVATLIERHGRAGIVELSAVLTGEATVLSHPAHAHFAARYDVIRRFLTRLFHTLREQERVSSTLDAATLATITIATMDGLHTQWLYARDGLDVDSLARSFLGSFVPELDPSRGLSAPGSQP